MTTTNDDSVFEGLPIGYSSAAETVHHLPWMQSRKIREIQSNYNAFTKSNRNLVPGRIVTSNDLGCGVVSIVFGLPIFFLGIIISLAGNESSAAAPAVIIAGIFVLLAGTLFVWRYKVQSRKQNTINSFHNDLLREKNSRIVPAMNSLLGQIRQIAEQTGDAAREFFFTDYRSLIYSREFVAIVDMEEDLFCWIPTMDIREAKIDTRALQSSSHTTVLESSRTRESLGGAAIGGILFGEAGAIVGAVAGNAGQRKQTSTTQTSIAYSTIVDCFTRISDVPAISIDFGSNDNPAKVFYGTIAVSLESQKK